MITLRKANDRGRANHDWLDSRHTFSFANYHDPQHMGFSALRVINDDRILPASGFDTHGHKNMEIISFVQKGALEHKDSEGNIQLLPAGEFQLMSAGSGIYHSEYNASYIEDAQFLQIWILPNITGTKPSYQQRDFGQNNGLTLVASPDAEKNSLHVKQDVRLYQLILQPNSELDFDIAEGRKLYVHQIRGQLGLDEHQLEAGDGGKVESSKHVLLANKGDVKVTALLFDLP